MQKILEKKRISIPAAQAWELLSDLSGPERYLPGISHSRVYIKNDTLVRQMLLMDGHQYEEQFDKIDEVQMCISYHMAQPSPFIYNQLKGTITITPVNNKTCEISWACSYKVPAEHAKETDALLSFIITCGINGVERACRKTKANQQNEPTRVKGAKLITLAI